MLAKSAGPEKEPRQFPGAEDVFNQIKNGDIEGMVSQLVLIEVRNAMRIYKGKEKNILTGMDKEERIEYVCSEGESAYNSIIKELICMGNSIKFKMKKTIDMNKLLDDASEIMSFIKGKVKTHRNCRKCGTNNVNSISFKSLGPDDALHVLIAKELGCKEFLTFDNDFKEIINHPKISPLKITVLPQQF